MLTLRSDIVELPGIKAVQVVVATPAAVDATRRVPVISGPPTVHYVQMSPAHTPHSVYPYMQYTTAIPHLQPNSIFSKLKDVGVQLTLRTEEVFGLDMVAFPSGHYLDMVILNHTTNLVNLLESLARDLHAKVAWNRNESDQNSVLEESCSGPVGSCTPGASSWGPDLVKTESSPLTIGMEAV